MRLPKARLLVALLLIPTTAAATEEPTGALVGRVTDRSNGAPLPGATVLVQGLSRGATTDSSGHFAILGLAPGRYRLEGRMLGYRTGTVEVEVRASRPDVQQPDAVLKLQLLPLVVKEMRVTAARFDPLGAERSPMFVRVIPSESFEGTATTLPEVLSRASGVQIRTLGGLGSYSTVSIRGTTSQQVKVYLDGIALNAALGGGVNLGDIPLSNVDRIEVYKGNIPARFGGGGIGGVVNIVTKGVIRRYGNGGTSYGSFGSRLVHGLFCRRWDRLGYVLGVDYVKSDNTFPYLDDNATPLNPEDDTWTKWRNNDFESLTLLAKGALVAASKLTLSLSNNYYQSGRGIPGTGSLQSQLARVRTTRNLAEAHALYAPPFWKALQLDLMGFHSAFVTDYKDPEGEVGLGKQDNHNVTSTRGAKAHAKTLIGGAQVLSLFVHIQRERYKPSDKLHDTPRVENTRTGYGWAAEDEIFLFGDRVTLLATLQWDRYESRFLGDLTQGRWVGVPEQKKKQTLLSRHVGVKCRLWPGAVLKANVAKYYRAPSFYELFGDKGWVIGNTTLRPEAGLNRDVGLRVEGDLSFAQNGFLELACYANDLDDLIEFVQYSQKEVFKPENIGEADIRGVEITAGCALFARLQVDVDYTNQEALNRTTLYGGIYKDKRLPNKPKHDFDGRIEWSHRGRASVFYEYAASSANFRDRYNKVLVPKRAIHNVGGTVYLLSQKLRVTLEGKNLTDNQVADLWGYPLPGRSWYITVRGVF